MAHLIETMAYAGESPWHGLGVQVEDNLTAEEMLKAAGLDWTVSKRDLYINGRGEKSGSKIKIDEGFAIVRDTDQQCLSVVGPNYIPVQNHEAFGFFKAFVEAGGAKMETAGSLKGGRHIWGLAKFTDGFELPGRDKVKGYLLVSQPHTFGTAMQIKFTPIRVVCNNTLTMSLNASGESFRMPHVRAFDAVAMDQAKETLGLAQSMMDSFKDKTIKLATSECSDEQLKRYLVEVLDPGVLRTAANDTDAFAMANRLTKTVYGYVNLQPGADLESSKGTYWGALNAVTFVIDHRMGRDRDSSLHNAWFGPRASIKQRAYDIALAKVA